MPGTGTCFDIDAPTNGAASTNWNRPSWAPTTYQELVHGMFTMYTRGVHEESASCSQLSLCGAVNESHNRTCSPDRGVKKRRCKTDDNGNAMLQSYLSKLFKKETG